MLLILTDTEYPTHLIQKLKDYGLDHCATALLKDIAKFQPTDHIKMVVYYGKKLILGDHSSDAINHLRHLPLLWFPGRILISKNNWVRSFETGMDLVPGNLENLEVLLAKIRQVLNPDNDQKSLLNTDNFLSRIHQYLEQHHLDKDFSIEKMGLDLGMSRTNFYSKVKNHFGISPSRLVMRFRLTKAEKLLQTHRSNISEVAYRSGFSSTAYFSKCFKDFFGKRPSDFVIVY